MENAPQRRLTRGKWTALAILALGLTILGADKSPATRALQRFLSRGRTDAVTSAEIACGYRVAGTDVGGPVEMPAGAVTNELLRRRGGHDWAFRVESDSWRSSWKGGVLTGVTVLARGEVRPDIGTLYYPVPVTNGVSLLPEARWGLLPNGGASVFSHAVTTNGSLLLDWRNALVGRDPDTPTNLQMEIFSDGSFVWRTDGGSTSYLPVLPFDYDGDGLENSVDPEPLSPNPVDAHGTPAEWYCVVCSNVFETAGGDLGWKEGVNTNAYYFVDVVAEEGPAPIWFNADRDSRLGSPVVVAWGGETNRVPLLIGVEYSVTSTVPFSVTLQEGGFAEVLSSSDRTCTLKWPLEFSYSARGTGYEVSVGPYDPGGTIAWERTALLDPFDIGGGARLLSSLSPSGCAFTTGERSLTFTCAHCSCAGCSVSGRFSLEGTCHDLGSFCCSCVYDPQDEDEPGGGESAPSTPDSPSVDVRFSQPAVIFEDAYANSSTETVGKRSTSTTVEIEAHGGADGGVVVVSMTNPDKLQRTGGPALPTSFMVGPNTRRTISVEYQGNRASASEGDIVVTAQISGSDSTASASATSVQLVVTPEHLFPSSLVNRHVFGVCETATCQFFPERLSNVSWQFTGNILDLETRGSLQKFQYLLDPGDATLTFTYASVIYPVQTQCVVPTAIVCTNPPELLTYNTPIGHAGGVGMRLCLTLSPSNVSFIGLRLKEVATSDGVATGYFAHPDFSGWRSHTHVQGANRVISVGVENNFFDTAAIEGSCPPLSEAGGWSVGDISWTIPVVWREPSDFSVSRGYQNLSTERQMFTIDAEGTVGVEKFNRRVARPVGGTAFGSEIP